MSSLLRLTGEIIVAGDIGLTEGTAQCLLRSKSELDVEFDFEAGPCHWAGRLTFDGEFFFAAELATLTPETVSPISVQARLFRNAFNEREWLLHGLWREDGIDHFFDAELTAE